MKYFSVSFNLTSEDYSVYSKNGIRASLILRLKKIIFPLAFFIVAGLVADMPLMLMFIPLLFASGIIVPYIVDKDYVKALYKNSFILKKEMTVDFYDNHFVITTNADEFTKSSSEKHFGFDTVAAVNENDTFLFFIFRTNNILIVPKRALSPEQYGMIKNLIENLFADKYRKI